MPRLALGVEPVGDRQHIRIGFEHRVEFGIELADAREVGCADRMRRARAGAHRVLKLSDGGFLELEIGMYR